MRRLLVAVVIALSFAGAAAAATATDPLQPQEWWLADVGADAATPPGPGVPITILDSGVDPTHPEFAGRPNTTFFNTQTVGGREEYHGTIVASIAVAPANGVGIVGVYPTAALQVYDASVDPRGISDNAAVAGIKAAAAHCPGVINMSFGGVLQDPDLHDAVLTAVRNGCLVVAAAGNSGEEGSPPTYPADWPHVLTVAATDENNAVTSFSSRSPAVDIAAPGTDMVGAVPLSRDPTGYLNQLSGTSFSSPIVAAAAAWVWALRPTLSASQVAQVLRESAHDIGPPGFDTASGWGLLNIPAALAAPTPPPDPFEPNDDIDQVSPLHLFQSGQQPVTTPAKPSGSVTGTIQASEDPRDVYRIWVPAKRVVRVSVSSGGAAAARIWGPKTTSIGESVSARRRDLRGTSIRGAKKGFAAYVEVLLTGRSLTASYTLTITASKR